jgi:hypothetical protein
MTFYVRTPGNKWQPARMDWIQFGPNTIIEIGIGDSKLHIAAQSRDEFEQRLADLIQASIRTRSDRNPPTPTVAALAAAIPVTTHADAEPAQVQRFDRRPTLADIPGPTLAHTYNRLIARFQHTLPDVAELLREDYKRQTGAALAPTVDTNPDVEALAPMRDHLLDETGQPKWGAVAAAARALGVQNAGAGFKRAKQALEHLRVRAA